MKLLITILVTLVTIATCKTNALVNYAALVNGGKVVTQKLSLPRKSEDCPTNGVSCEDCNFFKYCRQGQPPILTKCPDNTFCQDGTANTPLGCYKKNTCGPAVDPNYPCLGVGMFPDFSNCRSYRYCRDDGLPVILECDIGTYFDLKTLNCEKGTGTCKDPCQKISFGYVSLETDNKYVICLNSKVALVTACPTDQIFQEENNRCGPGCTAEGNTPSSDCTSFVKCTKNVDNTFKREIITCPKNTYFRSGKCEFLITPPVAPCT